MRILVAYASKHGSTATIAKHVAAELREAGNEVDLASVDAIADVQTYEAFVIGSAVYYGAWMKEATAFVALNAGWLIRRPVWLFSSGPVGTAAPADPKDIVALGETINPRGHRVFYGALDRRNLSVGERIVVGAVKAPDGDFRDWKAIEAWSHEIAGELAKLEPVPA
ncbi:MAG TPA: flavodoxin domain-containing protein [Candidatus Limnocylindria bacterium]|nr:flavodoxin domain-containing protein [Candidatus Limnocylindria bacterium]